jgi:hypothetical protein
MAGLVPAIHVCLLLRGLKTWMPGMKPGMTGGASLDHLVAQLRRVAPETAHVLDREIEDIAQVATCLAGGAR